MATAGGNTRVSNLLFGAATIRRCLGSVVSLLVANPAWSQIPLSIEELQVDHGVVKLDFGVTVGQVSQLVSELQWQVLDSGEQPVVYTKVVPRSVHSSMSSLSIRWGVAPGLEVNTSIIAGRQSVPVGVSGHSQSTHHIAQIGASYRLLSEGSWPALLVEASWDVLARDQRFSKQWQQPGDFRLGATLWRSLEPVVLSLTAGYQKQGNNKLGGVTIDTGDSVYVSPRINFAVNHRVTLIGGIGLHLQAASYGADQLLANREHSSSVLLGAGLVPGPRSTLFIYSNMSLGSRSSANVSVNWRYDF